MKQCSTSGLTVHAALLSCVFAGSMLASPVAQGTIKMSVNAGGACKAASGPGADVFYFDSQLVQNTSASVQYLTCFMPEINLGSSRSAQGIQVIFNNPTSADLSITCVIQAGYHPVGANSAVRVTTVPANGSAVLMAASIQIPVRPDAASPYTLSCAMPAQSQIGLILMTFPDSVNTSPL